MGMTTPIREGGQQPSPIPGKSMNCTAWAQYEPAGSSNSSRLCHGGLFHDREEGTTYRFSPCPARHECKEATLAKQQGLQPANVRRLPLLNPRSIEDLRPAAQSPAPAPAQRRFFGGLPSMREPFDGPTTIPAHRAPQRYAYGGEGYFPQPVVPPEEYPHAMQTPYAAPTPTLGGPSPTFLPQRSENVWSRLFKNVTQGMVASTGWQVFDYARTVDLFK